MNSWQQYLYNKYVLAPWATELAMEESKKNKKTEEVGTHQFQDEACRKRYKDWYASGKLARFFNGNVIGHADLPKSKVNSTDPWDDYFTTDPEEYDTVPDVKPAKVEDANVITSKVAGLGDNDLHRPVIDLKSKAHVVPSTSGNHLYLEQTLSWRQYAFLLWALKTVGLIKSDFYLAAMKRHMTVVRLPWIKKQFANRFEPEHHIANLATCPCPFCTAFRALEKK